MALLTDELLQLLAALQHEQAEFLVVGGVAVLIHGYARTTHDVDLWVRPTPENGRKVLRAAETAGHSVSDLKGYDFTRMLNFHLGRGTHYADIMTLVKGLTWAEADAMAITAELEGIPLRFLHLNHLIQAKEAAGRLQDLADVERLRRIHNLTS